MSRLLVVTAIDVEARGLARHLGLVRTSGPAPDYRGSGFDLACAGPRARHLDRLADRARAASLVISAGTCGALAPDLAAGDLVVPAQVITGQGALLILSAAGGLPQSGALVSVDGVVETATAKARLAATTGARAVDMESAAVVTWAHALGRPAVVVRAVSETAERGVPAALAGVVDDRGSTHLVRVARAVLLRPTTIPHALRLGRGTALALRRVAAALRLLEDAMRTPYPAGPEPASPRAR